MKSLALVSGCLFVCISAATFAQTTINPAQVHLGSVQVGASITATVTVSFPAAATLGSIVVLAGGGGSNQEFTSLAGGTCATGASYAANASCSTEVSFMPLYAGKRYGSVQFLDVSGNLIEIAYLRGTGIAPQTSFSPGKTIVFDTLPEVNGVAVDGNNTAYVSVGAIGATPGFEVAYTQNNDGSYTYKGQIGSWVEPKGVWVDAASNTYVYDAVQGLWKNGAYPILGSVQPIALTGDAFGNLYLIDANSNIIYKETLQPNPFPSDSTYVQSTVTAALSSPFYDAYGIWLDWSGNLYIADNSGIHKWTVQPNGEFTETYRAELGGRVTVDGAGNMYGYNYEIVFQKQTLQADGSYRVSNLQSTIYNSDALAADGLGNLYHADNLSGMYETVQKDDYSQAPALNFANTPAGSSSSAQTVTITNSGTAPLRFSSVVFPADFAPSASSDGGCATGATLSIGASCTLSITFSPIAPVAVGSSPTLLNESVTLITNTLNAPGTQQNIFVSGSETAPSATTTNLTLSPGSYLTPGEKLTLTIVVKAVSGSAIPTGTVTLALPYTNATVTATLDATGTAVVNTTAPVPGAYTVYATYGGSPSMAGSVSNTVGATVTDPLPQCKSCSVFPNSLPLLNRGRKLQPHPLSE